VVLFLFLSEGQIDEDLLQTFVHVVDAELFETVALKYLKAINIEHTDALASCANISEPVAADCESATTTGVTPRLIV